MHDSSESTGPKNDPHGSRRADHVHYIRAVYAAAANSRLRLGVPEIGYGEPLRTATISLRTPFRGSRLDHIESARLLWDEKRGWRFRAIDTNGGDHLGHYPLGVIPAPRDLLAWAAEQLDALRLADGVMQDSFRATDRPMQTSLDDLFGGLLDGVDGPDDIEQRLTAYGSDGPGLADLMVATPGSLAKRSDSAKEVGVAVTELTDVMRDHLMDERRDGPFQGEFSIRRGTWKRGSRLCVFIDSGQRWRRIAGLGIAAATGPAGDFERRLQVDHFMPVSELIGVDRLKDRLRQYGDALENNGPVSEARGRRLLSALSEVSSGLAQRIADLAAILSVEPPTTEDRWVRPFERDGVGVMFEAFDIDRELLLDWHPSANSQNFIDELPNRELAPQEDWHIAYDQDTFLGWIREHTDSLAWGVFRNRYKTRSLLVANANRTDLETVLGVDLIYYNPCQGSFVMLQYKKMEKTREGLISRVDARFRSQLERMREVDRKYRDDVVGHPDLRLVDTPCFIKLCEPQARMANSTELVQGMYLTREHFETVHSTVDGQGPRGGRRVGYRNTPRYLTNTEFTSLLSNGWIGSRGTGTEALAEQVKMTLEADRSVIFGVHLDDLPLTNFSSGRSPR